MPNKSRRIAAKQAELGQKKRRAPKNASRVVVDLPAEHVGDATRVKPEPLAPVPYNREIPAHNAPVRISQLRPQQTPNIQTHNPYIWPEIQRIGIISVFVFIILAVLTITLG